MTNQLIIFGERSHPPRICESQTSKTSVLVLALADRAWVLQIQNGHHKTQNTRNKGSLIRGLVSHRKKDVHQREEMRQIFKFQTLAPRGINRDFSFI